MENRRREACVLGDEARPDLRWAWAGALAFCLSLALVLLLGAEAFGAPGTTRTVDRSPGCDTIQDCVDVSDPGDTVRVPVGQYRENVTVDKQLKIEGTDCARRREIIVDAQPGGVEGTGFLVTADRVSIRCLTVRNGSVGIQGGDVGTPVNNLLVGQVTLEGQNDDGVLVFGDGAVVQNSQVRSNGDNSVEVNGNGARVSSLLLFGSDSSCVRINGDDATVEKSRAERCEDGEGFEVNGDDALVRDNSVLGSQEGITVEGAAVRVTGNQSNATSDQGFDINCTDRCDEALVQGNRASRASNDDEGFFIESTTPGLRVIDNTSLYNLEEGFEADTFRAIFRGNTAEYNGSEGESEGHGFLIDGDGNRFEDNTSRRNKRDGFFLDTGNNNAFVGNFAGGNSKDGFDLDDESGSNNRLLRNTAVNNRAEGFENNALLTDVVDNDASDNRIDCANSGTIDLNEGNDCADGSDFGVPPEVE